MAILSEGANSGSTFVDDNSVGTIAWSNPGRAVASDFGGVVSAKLSLTGSLNARVDHVTLTVYYIERGALMSMTRAI